MKKCNYGLVYTFVATLLLCSCGSNSYPAETKNYFQSSFAIERHDNEDISETNVTESENRDNIDSECTDIENPYIYYSDINIIGENNIANISQVYTYELYLSSNEIDLDGLEVIDGKTPVFVSENPGTRYSIRNQDEYITELAESLVEQYSVDSIGYIVLSGFGMDPSDYELVYTFENGYYENHFLTESNFDINSLPQSFSLQCIRPMIDGIPVSVPSLSYEQTNAFGYELNETEYELKIWKYNVPRLQYINEDSLYEITYLNADSWVRIGDPSEIVPLNECIGNSMPSLTNIVSTNLQSNVRVYAAELTYVVATSRLHLSFSENDRYFLIPVWSLYCILYGDYNYCFSTVYIDARTGMVL